MLHHLDAMIRELLGRRVGHGIDPAHVGFEPPDDTWRSRVRSSQDMWLNAYLVELSENRRLRDITPVMAPTPAGIEARRPPVRLDCHYLVTAWSPSTGGPPAVEPTMDEHAVLASVVGVLFDADPFSATAIYSPAAPPAAFPPAFVNDEFPRAVLPPDGYPKLSEFWLTMGQTMRLKPAVHLVVTIPIALLSVSAGPPVTMIRLVGEGEVTLTIGGTVRSVLLPAPDGSPGPAPGAFVELRTLAGQRLAAVTADADARFRFSNLASGEYRLRAAHPDGGSQEVVINIPNNTVAFNLIIS